jgi:hypothetical protein
MNRRLAGPRNVPPCSGRIKAQRLRSICQKLSRPRPTVLHHRCPQRSEPNWDSTPGPPITAPPGQPGDESRPQNGISTTFGSGRVVGWGWGVGAGVCPGGGVGVGLDPDPHTDPIVCLSVQVSWYLAIIVVCCDRPLSGVSPGVMRNPYHL